MDLLEVIEKSKAAKHKGKEIEYPGTPVIFEFRPLSLNEFAMILEGAISLKEEDKDKTVLAMVKNIEKVLSLDPIMGWKNMTIRWWEEISRTSFGYEEAQLDEPVEFSSASSRKALLALAKVNDKGDVENVGFATFASNGVLLATTEAANKIAEQKKT